MASSTKRATLPDQSLGGRAYGIPLLPGSAAGKWSIEAYANPQRRQHRAGRIHASGLRSRAARFHSAPGEARHCPGEPVEFSLDARFLYSAPASGLDVTGAIRLQVVEGAELAGFPSYVAGLADDDFTAIENQFSDKVQTDDKGHADLSVELPEGVSTRPLRAKLIVDVGEPGGRSVEHTLVLPMRSKGVTVGVKKDFDALLSAADVATFEAIAVAPDGACIVRKDASWSLYQVTNDYQWFNADGHWSYEPVKSSKRIASGTIDVGVDAPAKFSGRVNWGAHRLELKTLDGEQTSVAFDVGWSGTAGADTPDNVVVTLDKTNYTAGEEAKLRSASPQPSPVRRQSHWSATRSSASSMSISCPAIMLCPLRSAPTGTPALTPSR
jgi:alpha-2-macroglobulin